jgi:mannose-6-phosphate isomerase-like protein (cupin superfamily)
MSDVSAKRYSEMEGAFGGGMRKVRAELGLRAFGVQSMHMPPNYDGYPMHDHASSGQEELYVTLSGSGTMEVEGGESIALDPEVAVRVGPAQRRKVIAGPEGIRLLVVGGTPGAVYEPWPATELDG